MKNFEIRGKKIIILPEAIKAKWRKERIGEIVDVEQNGEMARDVFYYIEIEKEKSLQRVNAIDFLQMIKDGQIKFKVD